MKKKEKITLGVIALLLVVTIVGVSYAAFTFGQSGKNLNTVTTGIMQMSYEETSNIIKMTGALPTTDTTGKARLNEGEYFDFTVSSTIQGEAEINWEIAAEDFSSNTFDSSHVKLYLTTLDSSGNESEVMAPTIFTKVTTANTKTGRPANMMSLATGVMSSSTRTKYRLRMWVDESYNPQGDGGNKKFAVRINVYGKVAEEVQGSKMKAYDFSTNTNYSKVTRIVTSNTLTPPSQYLTYKEDLSAKGDGSVMAYVLDNTLTIAANDTIVAGDYLRFKSLSKVTSIDLTYLDTSKVTDMSYMFYNCGVTSLDVSNFNTSNVTNMRDMFDGCSSLTNLDVSNLDTSKVTNMCYMFANCSSLTNLDVSNFNTSNVTNMCDMFQFCSGLTSLDLSNFDTSSVTDLSGMFSSCSKLASLNFTGFNTSKVTNFSGMFSSCTALKELDLTSFDTSSAINMRFMFDNCRYINIVKVSSKWVIGTDTDVTGLFSDCRNISEVTYV